MIRYITAIVLACLSLGVQLSHGDEVILNNGDRLTGKIDHLVDGKMLFKSDLAGEITVVLSNIRTFSSDGPVTVNLKDGTGLVQQIAAAAPGRFAVVGTDALRAQEFAVDDIASINPPAKPAPKWTGSISAGVTSTHGNTKTEMVSANADVSKRTEKDRTQFSADYAKGDQEDPATGQDVTIENWWRARGKYDYFLSKKMYIYADGRYEKDDVALLDRRVIVGGGSGIQWIESEVMNFSTESGLASLYEKYDNMTDSKSELTMQLGYHFDRKINSILKFTHDLTYYPSIEKLSDYFLTSTAGIRADFDASFFANFKTIFNYNVTPAIGAGSTDVKYFFGIGYNF
ncbi:MAG: DUF481 domain-containing protein [Planctomycetota bacterium]|jgi:putative salt-induced outer membrane protein YdiY